MPTVPAAAAPPPATQSAFTTAALSVLGAIGTGIGVLGFLTFVGGATWLARYRGAGLSGTYGISVLPRSELIATGADQLLGPAVAAIAGATLVLAALLAARWAMLELREWTGIIVALVLAAGGFAFGWYFPHEVGPPLGERVRVPFAGAVAISVLGAALVVMLARRAYEPGQRPQAARAIALAVAVAGTVLAYGAFETYARNLARPEVRPAAVLDASGAGFAGYYVGQDSDTIYVGVTTPRLPHSSGPRSTARIVQLPLTAEVRVAVGSTFAPRAAQDLADDLLADLRTQHGP